MPPSVRERGAGSIQSGREPVGKWRPGSRTISGRTVYDCVAPHLKISRIADWNNGAVLACWQYLRFYDWVIFSLGYCGGYRRRELQAAPKVLNAAVRVKECGIHGANDCFFIPPDMSAPNLSSRFVMPIYTIDTEAGLVTALQSGATCGEDSPMILDKRPATRSRTPSGSVSVTHGSKYGLRVGALAEFAPYDP